MSKTVSVLLVAISISLLSFLAARSHLLPAILLGGLTAFGLTMIEIYYTSIGRIRWVYLLDAAPEFLFGTSWLYLLVKRKELVNKTPGQPAGGVAGKPFKNPYKS